MEVTNSPLNQQSVGRYCRMRRYCHGVMIHKQVEGVFEMRGVWNRKCLTQMGVTGNRQPQMKTFLCVVQYVIANFFIHSLKKYIFTRTSLQRRCQWEHDRHGYPLTLTKNNTVAPKATPKSCLVRADSWFDQKTKRLQLEKEIKFGQDFGVVFCAVSTLLHI